MPIPEYPMKTRLFAPLAAALAATFSAAAAEMLTDALRKIGLDLQQIVFRSLVLLPPDLGTRSDVDQLGLHPDSRPWA